MKSFIIALIVLFLTLALVATVSAIAASSCLSLLEMTKALPTEEMAPGKVQEEILRISEEFDRLSPRIGLAVPHSDLMRAEELIAALESTVKSESTASYETALFQLREMLEHLLHAVLPQLSDIF